MSTLPPDQQARYLEVLDAAKRLYGGDIDAAMHWMSRPIKAFGGKPLPAWSPAVWRLRPLSSMPGVWSMDSLPDRPRLKYSSIHLANGPGRPPLYRTLRCSR